MQQPVNPQALMQQAMQQMLALQQQQMVSPEEQRRQQVRKALAAAGKSMVSTPGNALTGIGAGAAAGAEAYHDDASKRTAHKDQMDTAKSILSGARSMSADKRSAAAAKRAVRAEERAIDLQKYTRDRQAKLDDARLSAQKAAAKFKAAQEKRKRVIDVEKATAEYAKQQGLTKDSLLSGDDRAIALKKVEAYRQRLMMQTQPGAPLPGATPAAPTGTTVPKSTAAKPKYTKGQSAKLPDGRTVVFNGKKWVVQQ